MWDKTSVVVARDDNYRVVLIDFVVLRDVSQTDTVVAFICLASRHHFSLADAE